MPQKFDLSIVLPMCHPKAGWEKSLKQNIQLLQIEFNYAVAIEYVIVNDGFENSHLLSLFDVVQQAEENVRFISYSVNMGKGYALRTGVAAATAPLLLQPTSTFRTKAET